MELLPEWMNNIHPLIVHFPIALLVFAVLTDFAGIVFKNSAWLKKSALGLYVIGSLGAVAAYFSGKQAADLVDFPTLSYPVISEHADLALYTMLFFVVYTIARLIINWKKWDEKKITVIILFLISLGGLFLLKETAEHGGELVFKYGVGTAALSEKETEKSEIIQPTQKDIAVVISENGSWEFKPGSNAVDHFRKNFNLIKGRWSDLSIENENAPNGRPILKINSNTNEKHIFSLGSELNNLQMTVRLNEDKFNGAFAIIHHINRDDTYDFVQKEKDKITIGRIVQGKRKIYDKGNNPEKGWITLKAVGSSGHYRGYVNSDLVVHGHAKDLPAGTAGFYFAGKGILYLSVIKVASLDKSESAPMEMNADEHSHNH